MGRLCVCWMLVCLAIPAFGAGLTGEVEQRRAAELEAQQSAIRSSLQSGSGASLEQRMEVQRRRRGQQMERFRFEQQQQRQQTLPPPSLAPLELQPSPGERAEQDTRRRAREVERLQQQTLPNR